MKPLSKRRGSIGLQKKHSMDSLCGTVCAITEVPPTCSSARQAFVEEVDEEREKIKGWVSSDRFCLLSGFNINNR